MSDIAVPVSETAPTHADEREPSTLHANLVALIRQLVSFCHELLFDVICQHLNILRFFRCSIRCNYKPYFSFCFFTKRNHSRFFC